MIDGKRCTRCRQTKPLTAFYARKAARDGRQSWCSACVRERAAERWREQNPEQEPLTERPCFRCKQVKPVSAFSPKSWQCKPCAAAATRAARAADPMSQIKATLRRYSMSPEQYDERLAAQGGVCALCRRPPKKSRLHVDHDHRCCPPKRSCGRCVRGLVCWPCNAKLAILESNSEYAQRARAYAGVEVRRIE